MFVLETMLWPDEIREPEFKFLEEDVDLRPQELKMASSLIESMEGDFDPTEYKDAYREAVQEIIEAKIEGKELVAQAPEEEAPAAADLLSALQASVEAAKKSRAAGGSGEDGEDGKAKARTSKAKPGDGKPGAGGGAKAKTSASKTSASKTSAAKTSPSKTKARSGTRKSA